MGQPRVRRSGILVVLLYLVPSTAITGQTHRQAALRDPGRAPRRLACPVGRPRSSASACRCSSRPFLGVALQFGPLGLVVAVLGMIGWISHPNRQGLHDRLAKTVVVEA